MSERGEYKQCPNNRQCWLAHGVACQCPDVVTDAELLSLYQPPPVGAVIGIDRGYDFTAELRSMRVNHLLGSERE